MTRLLIVLVVVLIVSLSIFSILGKWSLADALSEESSVQPVPNQVKMVASSSRLIALLGLMGILAAVLGIGYSIVWSLFTGQAANLNLGEIRKFLFGAATLFAPYLANQLRAIFDDSSPKPGPAAPVPAAAPAAAPPAAPVPAPAPAVAPPVPPAPPVPGNAGTDPAKP
jgi:ABC-type multidrug transport system fused ATPase/permease subunit